MSISNKYQIEQHYIDIGKSRSGQKINKVRFVVSHDTGNNTADADDHYRYFNKNQEAVSAHTFIDAKKILEIVPLWEKAWHVQYNKPTDNQLFGADANDAAIGVELCRPGDFNESFDRYVWYHAYLCRKFNLNPQKDIVSHKKLDPSRRSDPVSWFQQHGVSWENFIYYVTDYYNRWHDEEEKTQQAFAPIQPESDSADGKLVRGEKGTNVQLLNQMLHTLEYTTKTDDLFDQYTEAALIAFQKDHGLPQDGIYTSAVGQEMLKAIAEKNNDKVTVEVNPLPAKAPEMVRLAKLIDTTNPELMKTLKEQGYIVIDIPKS